MMDIGLSRDDTPLPPRIRVDVRFTTEGCGRDPDPALIEIVLYVEVKSQIRRIGVAYFTMDGTFGLTALQIADVECLKEVGFKLWTREYHQNDSVHYPITTLDVEDWTNLEKPTESKRVVMG